MFGLSLIFIIVITGGIIAFFGDRIGTRVGKRRMTLWGYTACLACVLDPAAMPPLSAFRAGSAEFPDQSATLCIAVGGLMGGGKKR